VKEAIHQILLENLHGKDYNGEECTEWCKNISNQLKVRLKGQLKRLELPTTIEKSVGKVQMQLYCGLTGSSHKAAYQ
jgi:hypothetical protein